MFSSISEPGNLIAGLWIAVSSVNCFPLAKTKFCSLGLRFNNGIPSDCSSCKNGKKSLFGPLGLHSHPSLESEPGHGPYSRPGISHRLSRLGVGQERLAARSYSTREWKQRWVHFVGSMHTYTFIHPYFHTDGHAANALNSPKWRVVGAAEWWDNHYLSAFVCLTLLQRPLGR